MKNVYDGVVKLDSRGDAWVALPDYSDALKRDFRYQLTCIGGFAQVYIAEEISGNRFKIVGGNEGLKISWPVTGIRQDAWAEANRIQVEVEKNPEEQAHATTFYRLAVDRFPYMLRPCRSRPGPTPKDDRPAGTAHRCIQ